MRISIWQQFSSNHSASFTIVGTFKSAEDAERTASFLRGIVQQISTYWRQLPPDEREALWKRMYNYREQPLESTPIEQALSRELNVEWSKNIEGQPRAIDWIPTDAELADGAVKVMDNHVFIKNIGRTWVGSEPFETLLRREAISVVGNYEVPKSGAEFFGVRIRCHAPDDRTATRLMVDFRETGENTGDFRLDRLILMDGLLIRHDLDLTYTGWPLASRNPWEIVPIALEYLRSQGCTNIRYEFYQA